MKHIRIVAFFVMLVFCITTLFSCTVDTTEETTTVKETVVEETTTREETSTDEKITTAEEITTVEETTIEETTIGDKPTVGGNSTTVEETTVEKTTVEEATNEEMTDEETTDEEIADEEMTTDDETTEHVHIEVVDKAVDATCTETGWTEGKRCSDCGEVLIAQETVAALGHTWGDDHICKLCGDERTPTEGISYYPINDAEYWVGGIGTAEGTEIVIAKTYDDKPVTGIGDHAFYRCDISSVIIPNSIKTIDAGAFYESGIENVSIPNSVASIGDEAFYGCGALTSITIPNSITSIGYEAFYGCNILNEVHIADLAAWCNISMSGYYSNPIYYAGNLYINGEASSDLVIPGDVMTIGNYCFSGCANIERISIPGSVTSIGDFAFYKCVGLRSIKMSDGVDSIGGSAFTGCSRLTSITLPNTITSIGGYAFSACSRIEGMEIPSGVTSIGEGVFYKCEKIKSVTLPSGITEIGEDMFYNCGNLASIIIPNSVTSIGEDAFNGCSSLTNITIPADVISIGTSAFYNCYLMMDVCNLSSLNITLGSTDNGYVAAYAHNLYNSEDDSKLHTTDEGFIFYVDDYSVYLTGYTGTKSMLTLPESYEGNSYIIRQYAFYNNKNITSITIPEGVIGIDDYAFLGCQRLVEVCNLSLLDMVQGTLNHGCVAVYALNVCTSLDEVKLHMTDDGYIFYVDNETVYLIGYEGTETELDLPESYEGDSYIIYDYAFMNFDQITCVTIPDNVTSIGNASFEGCSKLTNVIIGNGVTSIGNNAFNNCYGMTSVTIGDSVTSIGESAFGYCDSLKSITIPDSVTSIGQSAFIGCIGLTSVTVPDSVTSIGSGAFGGCTNLESITLPFVGDSIKTSTDTFQYPFGYIFGQFKSSGGEATEQFYYGSSLSSQISSYFYIPDSLKTVTITGGNLLRCAFYNCNNITNIIFEEGISEISECAFVNCKSLISITIPKSVISIGVAAFDNCENLVSINFEGTMEEWYNISKRSDWDYYMESYTVYCTDGNITK